MELTQSLPSVIEIETPERTVRRTGQLKAFYLRLFGCWHLDMGLPITRQRQTYRACLDCGVHRVFDTETWKMVGPYFCSAVPQTEAQVARDLNS